MSTQGKTIKSTKKSKLHTSTLNLVRSLFPGFVIEEETRVQTGKTSLPVDIVIRELKVAIECHGVQHFEFTAHFHRTPEDFSAQRQRDRIKYDALRNAGWSPLVIRYDEIETMTTKKLSKLILAAIKEKQ